MTHLRPDEMIDAVDGTLDPALQVHLTRCALCEEEVARLRAALGDAKAVAVPEPSPLFWDHFSTRVRAAIELQPVPDRSWWPVWLRWPVLAPVTALALLVMALMVSIPREPDVVPTADAGDTAVVDDLATAGAAEWAVVAEIVGPVDIEQALEAGIAVTPGDSDRIAGELDADEQRELVRLIKEEMNKSGD
jgi:hypothetical protein